MEDALYKILYESNTIRQEVKKFISVNKELAEVLIYINELSLKHFGIPVVVTHAYRTQETQDRLYKNDPKYLKKKFTSPHQYNHAFDLRSRIYTKEQIKFLEDEVNKKFNLLNFYKWTAKFHNVGHGDHFHIQFIKKG